MMKKNLFLLFSFYFFVLQAVFVWLLRWDINFYRLAVINFVFLVIISLVSKEKNEKKISIYNENTAEQEVEKLEKQKEPVKPAKIKKIKKKRVYKPIPHIWLFIISILFWFFVWFWLWDIVLYLQLLTSVAGSFILFVVFGLLFKFKVLKVRETKIYMIVLIGLLLWSWTMMLNLNKINFDFLKFNTQNTNIDVNIDAEINEDGDVTTWAENVFVAVDEDNNENNTESKTGDVLVDLDLSKKATFADVIITLIDQNEIELNEAKNIKFMNITYSDLNYAYYRTAYDKQLIWKSVNPHNALLCETYIVMKWLVEWREVWSYWDIKKAYWNYAQENDKLSTCKYGDPVKLVDIK